MNIILSTLLGCLSLFCLKAVAQEEAVPAFSTNGVAVPYLGYSNGAGYEFSPNVEIAVTALGFGGMDLGNYPYQVSIYTKPANVTETVATAEVTTSSTFYNQTYYQSVTPVDLFPNQQYFIEASAVGDSLWVGAAISDQPQGGSFSVNSDIKYESAGNDFINGIPQNIFPQFVFFTDENFQFTVVPEPSILCLAAAGLAGMIWHRRRR
jgi:hypothetical protein